MSPADAWKAVRKLFDDALTEPLPPVQHDLDKQLPPEQPLMPCGCIPTTDGYCGIHNPPPKVK